MIKKNQVIEFFDSCGALTFEDVHIEQLGGIYTGNALVHFEDEQQAKDAYELHDLKELEGNEVSLKDHTHEDFQNLLSTEEKQPKDQKAESLEDIQRLDTKAESVGGWN